MKKTLLITLSILFGLSNYAQINIKHIENAPMSNYTQITDTNTPTSQTGGDEILWSNDFSDTTSFTSEDIAGFGDWRWSTTAPGGQWSENAGVIQSETPENGFMLMEADFFNTSPQNGVADGEVGENPINASFTVGPIDLTSDTEQLVLQFYSNYRICCYYSPSDQNDLNVYISTDGGETFNDLEYIEGETFEVNVEKQTLSQIPLGNYAPNTDGVYFKFEWIGTHYYWMIDDLSVIQRPSHDLKMQSAWLTMENPQYVEYYTIPENQMPDQMLIGAEVYNYGYSDEENISLSGSINGTSAEAYIEYAILESDSTGLIETEYFDVSMLTTGTYSFTAEITSSGDDPTLEDNTLTREFEISENTYAIDGLYTSSEWMGTGWPGGDDTADGVRYANYFDIKESTVLSSITIDLNTSEHPTSLGTFQTVPGGEIIAYVCDTTGIFDPNVTELNPEFGGAIWQSDFTLVDQNHVNWGSIVIDVPDLQLNPNAYYIVIEMYSNGLSNDILINDDTSVLQPWFASLVFYPNDQTWYSNPNAASIRIGLDGNNSVSENKLNGIDFFPNPANNFIEISSEQKLNDNSTISIYNMLGEIILQHKFDDFDKKQIIDINHIVAGSYIIELQNKQLKAQKKLIIE